jgi:hypothetical protein
MILRRVRLGAYPDARFVWTARGWLFWNGCRRAGCRKNQDGRNALFMIIPTEPIGSIPRPIALLEAVTLASAAQDR